jgi:hypothetical protein
MASDGILIMQALKTARCLQGIWGVPGTMRQINSYEFHVRNFYRNATGFLVLTTISSNYVGTSLGI